MGAIIAIANQKGGVGKTTTAINLASYLTTFARRVLLVDLDPQANATSSLGLPKREPSCFAVMQGDTSADEVLVAAPALPALHVLPASPALAALQVTADPEREAPALLRPLVDALCDRYAYVFLDSPPSLGLLTLAALSVASEVIIPVQCEYLALEGLAQLLETLERVRTSANPRLERVRVLLTMYDARTNLAQQVVDEVRAHFPGQVFETVIPRNVRLAEAPSYGQPIVLYDPFSRGAEGYRRLAEEVARYAATA